MRIKPAHQSLITDVSGFAPTVARSSRQPSSAKIAWSPLRLSDTLDEGHQSVHRQRKDQPAEQADADGIEDKSKGEHGGGSICKGITVAPSTTTAAQVRT
jgi:hypothetical protein